MNAPGTKGFDANLAVLRPNTPLIVGAALLSALGLGLLFAGLLHLFPPGIVGLEVAPFGLFFLYLLLFKNARPSKRRARVQVTAEGVVVDGVLRVARADIADGHFQPRRALERIGSSVRLLGKLGNVCFETEVEHEGQANELLHALGVDAASRRAQFRGSSPMYATLPRQMAWGGANMLVILLMINVMAWLHLALPAAFMMAVLPMTLVGLLPSKIVVGIDGILVQWLWWKRFIRMADIHGFTREDERAIRIDRHPGKGPPVTLYTGIRQRSKNGLFGDQTQHRDAVFARMVEASTAFADRATAPDAAALVGRGQRSQSEWVEALKKLAFAQPGYRESMVREDDLWRIMEDPTATEDARAGAAMVLRSSLDESGKSRVRVAASATASPKLRVALEATLADSAAQAEEALEALDHRAESGER